MIRSRPAGFLLVLVLAAPAIATAQQSADRTAVETVVVPGWPGYSGNKEIRIGGQEILNSEVTGPEFSVQTQVVQWEEGRSITVILPNGVQRVVPVASNIIFPPDLRPGGIVTFLVRQTSDGRFRVTGLTTGGATAPPLVLPSDQQQPPAPPPQAPPAAAPPPAGISAPPATTQPGPPPPRGKAVLGAAYMTVTGKVTAYAKGVSITIVESSGRERVLSLADGAPVPDGLAVGDRVAARVPLQKPFDGKTTDKIEKPKPKKTPLPSMFQGAESPKN